MTSTVEKAAPTSTVGAPVPRIEGPAKVTGTARYSADRTPPGVLHAVLVGAPWAAGCLEGIDVGAALAVPGVVAVLTEADLPRFGAVAFPAAMMHLPMQSDRITYEGEPVALVLAESLEAAERARPLVVVRMAREAVLLAGSGNPEARPDIPVGEDLDLGDVDTALAAAAHVVRAVYTQPPRHHNTIETSSTVAAWEGELLTLWDSTQYSGGVVAVLASALGIEPTSIVVHSRHVGGGFGCKAFVWPHEILTAAAARIVERPVKLHLRRSDQFSGTGLAPWTQQTIALGADPEGRLTALKHAVVNSTSMLDTHFEPASEAGKSLYACPNIQTRQSLERANTNTPTPMRAPIEGVGLWAVEGAMNELAHEVGLDPLDLRLLNHADTDPRTGRPWSSKELRRAYEVAAADFGWYDRSSAPARDGNWRLGRGMATATMGTNRFPGSARVELRVDGTAVVEVDFPDIGTGTPTVLRQVAAEELGLEVDAVSVLWGDTALPPTSPMFASSGTVSTGSAVALACREIVQRLGAQPGTAVATLARGTDTAVSAEGHFTLPGGAPLDADGGTGEYAMRSFGTVFVEVGVDPGLGLVRLRRVVGAYSAGRILNERTARAQMLGGVVWGWGKAVMEASTQDPGTGRWLSKNYSGVHVPVQADITSDIAVHFMEEFDPHASAIGVRGLGELGACGIDAAVAEAVFDAVGIRIRELPLTPKRVLDALAAAVAR